MGKTAGGCRAIGRPLRPQTSRLSVEPDGRTGQPAGLARDMGGPGRSTGRDAGKCQGAGVAGQPEHVRQPDGPECPRTRTCRAGQTVGERQGAGSARRPGHARAPGAPDWLARPGPSVWPDSWGMPRTRAGQTAGNCPAASRPKQPDWTGRRASQTAGWARPPSEPDSRSMPSGWTGKAAGRCRAKGSLKSRNGPGSAAWPPNGPGRAARQLGTERAKMLG